jgi:hypothetical protein
MEKIDLKSVKIALERDEMEEIVGGSGNTGGSGCYWAMASVMLFGVSIVASEGGSLLLFGAEGTAAVAGMITSCGH